jgi:hypothetical protein
MHIHVSLKYHCPKLHSRKNYERIKFGEYLILSVQSLSFFRLLSKNLNTKLKKKYYLFFCMGVKLCLYQ